MPEANPIVARESPNPMFRISNMIHGRGDIIHLELGEPNFPTPPHIVEAAQRSLRDERQGYGPGNGIATLRDAIAARVARVSQLSVDPMNVVACAGGTGAVMTALLTLCAPGDEVLMPDPAWAGYDAMLAASGTRRVRYQLGAENGWLPDLDGIEAAITSRTRVLLLNSPSNPTGTVFPREVVQRLVEIAERHDLWILSDECYDEIVFEGDHVSPAALGALDRTIIVGTCSKSYAMTGWRVGWAVVPPRLAGPFGLMVAAQINNLPLFVQRAAHAALTGPQDCVLDMVAAYRRHRDIAVELLWSRGVLDRGPQGAFYLLVPVARLSDTSVHTAFDSVAFAEGLIEAKGVAVAPGLAFGPATAGHVRVSLASGEVELRSGIAALLDFATSWKNV